MSTKSNFIPHIAGLRGLAVLLVVAQHFGVPGLDAGFIGVDIFFVISGFLITGILLDEYSKSRDPESRIGGISLKAFYLRRARRILPAATVVTIAIVVFSWIVNNSSRFSVVLNDAIWSTLFSANINFAMKSTDYFQIGAAPSPFQHFWSLSVEEQFYFIWPALILAALAFRGLRFRGKLVSWQNRLFFLFTVTTLASIAFMVVSFYFEPSLSYFLTVSRAWELSLGAVAAIFIRSEKGLEFQNKAKYLAYLPVPLLIISLLLVRSNNFAYTLPLIVIAAAIFVAKPANTKDWDARALSGRIPRFFGNISYSLYLWHWPVLTFGTELGYAETFTDKALLFALAIGLSTLSYYYVELKFQKISIPKFYIDNSVPPSKPAWISAATVLTVGVLALPSLAVQPATKTYVASLFERPAIAVTPTLTPTPQPTKEEDADWFTKRQAEIQASNEAIAQAGKLSAKQISEINRVADGMSYAQGFGFTCSWGDCSLGYPSAKTKILLIGDSHAVMYQAAFSKIRSSGVDLFVKSRVAGICPNFIGERSLRQEFDPAVNKACAEHHRSVIEYVSAEAQSYDFVVLSDSTGFNPDYYVEDATRFVNEVKKVAKKTIILGQAPISKDLSSCLNKEYTNYDQCSGSRPTSLHDYQVAQNAKVAFGDVSSLFCIKNYCPLIIGESPITSRDHLTDSASEQIAPFFLAFLRDASVPTK
jgi:peptidoglycan/LPS O-acetylase OafA/YrhL